ncbi:MAG: hypothetical protein AAF487_12180 [Bacteroidota bacterium]
MKFWILALLFVPALIAAQENVKLKIDVVPIDGHFEDVRIEIFTCNPDDPRQFISTSNKHKIYLPAGDTYFLTYNAPEFIAKTVQIDIPENLPSNITVEYQMNMFPQMEGDISLAYNKPVGYISFDRWFNVKVQYDYEVEIVGADTFEPILSKEITGL